MNDEDADFAFALQLQFEEEEEKSMEIGQEEFDEPYSETEKNRNEAGDFAYAKQLQEELGSKVPVTDGVAITDGSLELLDPTPEIRDLFVKFDEQFFGGKLKPVEVRWSPRMTMCAGLCCYEGRGGLCSIRLSLPLLKLRPRKDLVETLLHEMIHAYLFVTHNNKDHDAHGPEFCNHMRRINTEAGTNITIYHSFHDEVREYRQHWWKCNGPCRNKPPFYGMVKRAVNRAPGPSDPWHIQHQNDCGGSFIKIKEPEGFGQKNAKKNTSKEPGSRKKLGSPIANGSVLPYFKPINPNSAIGNSRNSAGPSTSGMINPPGGHLRTGPSPQGATGFSKTSGNKDLWSSGLGSKARVATINTVDSGSSSASGGGTIKQGDNKGLWNSGLGSKARVATISNPAAAGNSNAGRGGGGAVRGIGGQSRAVTQVVRKPGNQCQSNEPAFHAIPPRNPETNLNRQSTSWNSPGIRLGGNSPVQDRTANNSQPGIRLGGSPVVPNRRSVGEAKKRRSLPTSQIRQKPVLELDSSSDEEVNNHVVVRNPITLENGNPSETSECPICLKLISNSIINDHLDVCLAFRNS